MGIETRRRFRTEAERGRSSIPSGRPIEGGVNGVTSDAGRESAEAGGHHGL